MAVLRNRLVLLHHFSELFCPCIPMMHLQQESSVSESGLSDHAGKEDLSTGLDSLRGILMSTAKVRVLANKSFMYLCKSCFCSKLFQQCFALLDI